MTYYLVRHLQKNVCPNIIMEKGLTFTDIKDHKYLDV